jgi:hypothetical protein
MRLEMRLSNHRHLHRHLRNSRMNRSDIYPVQPLMLFDCSSVTCFKSVSFMRYDNSKQFKSNIHVFFSGLSVSLSVPNTIAFLISSKNVRASFLLLTVKKLKSVISRYYIKSLNPENFYILKKVTMPQPWLHGNE